MRHGAALSITLLTAAVGVPSRPVLSSPSSSSGLEGASRHSFTWAGLPCAGSPYRTPTKNNGTITPGHQDSGCGRRFSGNADGPLIGNGDVGAMLGASAASNISFWLTKNDFWDLAQGEEPECRYGTYNYTLFVPKMNITDHCGLGPSLDRNSQRTTAGISIQPLTDGFALPDANWSAVQHMTNGSTSGLFSLVDTSGTSHGLFQTRSLVVAPYDELASKVSFVLTQIELKQALASGNSSSTSVKFSVGTHGGGPSHGCTGACPEAGGRFAPTRTGKNESWGSWVTTTEGAPHEGLRSGKTISLFAGTRLLLGARSGGSGSKLIDGHSFSLAVGQSVWVVTAVLSNIDTEDKDPTATATAALQALTPPSVEAMVTHHQAWWADYWARSSVSFPTRTAHAERMWYSAQYVLAAATRFGGSAKKTAPSISSAWVIGSEHNAFTLDYNAEATMYGCAAHWHGSRT